MIRKLETNLNAFQIFTIFKDESHSFILDSGKDFDKLGRYSFIGFNPFDIVKFKNDKECIKKLNEKLNKYKVKNKTKFPFIGGAVGYISYDVNKYIENIGNLAVDDINGYDLYFGFYDLIIIIDNLENEKYVATPNLDIQKEHKMIDEICEKIENINTLEANKDLLEAYQIKTTLTSNFTQKQFEENVEKVREHIQNGDVYQINLTQRFSGETNLNSFDLYNRLRNISPATFGVYLNFDEFNILSNSPERFIKIKENNIETRPIKGTRPRGKDKKEDLELIEELKNSEKDKSELLMIVDLERNDLSKICKIKTVEVPELFKIETYSNVHHLVSSVVGELEENISLEEVIKATFPGGSITGAPKIKAMEIIDKLEPTKRNLYTGSIGYISFCGNIDLNIAIRTLIKKDEKIYFQVGCGITWDSNPTDEYNESLDKAKSIMKALNYER